MAYQSDESKANAFMCTIDFPLRLGHLNFNLPTVTIMAVCAVGENWSEIDDWTEMSQSMCDYIVVLPNGVIAHTHTRERTQKFIVPFTNAHSIVGESECPYICSHVN